MGETLPPNDLQVFTVGHSNQTLESFVGLLKKHGIEVLVDVRSNPYSKYANQFDKARIEDSIPKEGIRYLFLGKELGGQPAEVKYYDVEEYVLYSRLAESPLFREGINRLITGSQKYRVVIMCSEENPKECHRRLLIGRVLGNENVTVLHIRGDGSIQSEDDLVKEEAESGGNQLQLALFVEPVVKEWKSIRPVSQKKPPQSSSEE